MDEKRCLLKQLAGCSRLQRAVIRVNPAARKAFAGLSVFSLTIMTSVPSYRITAAKAEETTLLLSNSFTSSPDSKIVFLSSSANAPLSLSGIFASFLSAASSIQATDFLIPLNNLYVNKKRALRPLLKTFQVL
jgi:hypothetical protein